MMMAFDADASSTSDSLTAPTPEWMIRIFTFSSVSLVSVSASTSAEPCTSALMMIGSSFMPPSAICACSDSSVRRPPLAPSAVFFACSSRNVGDLPRLGRVGDLEHVARLRQAGQAEHFDRRRRPGRLDRLAAVVDQRAHAADDRAGDEGVADAAACRPAPARSPPDRGPCRASASSTVPDALRFGLALSSPMSLTSRIISSSRSMFCLLLRRHLDRDRLAAPVLRHQVELGQLALDALGIGVRLVDLVDRHDDRHVRPPWRGRSLRASAASRRRRPRRPGRRCR